jgi:hypothetical protein
LRFFVNRARIGSKSTKGEAMRKVLAAGVLVVAGLGASVGVGWSQDSPTQQPTSTSIYDPPCVFQRHGCNPQLWLTQHDAQMAKLEARIVKLERQVRALQRKR